MNILLRFLLRWFAYEMIDFKIISKGNYTDKLIESCLKKNQFVPLNSRREFYLKNFTLIELIRDKDCVSEVRIKHDIDSVITIPAKVLVIHGRFSGLQRMIDYFDKI